MKKINESFVCVNCWKHIEPARWTCRNHCPYCFASLHLDDIIPWDRKSNCKWQMYPIEYIIANGWIKISFKCVKCWYIHKNKAIDDDNIWELDDFIRKYKSKFNN